MTPGLPITGSLILLALFVAPGLLAIKASLYFSRTTDRTDRLDATIASLLTSVFSLIFLYTLVWAYVGFSPRWKALESAFSLPLFIHGYISLLSLAVLAGTYHGLYKHHVADSDFNISAVQSAISRDGTSLSSAFEPLKYGNRRNTRQEVWNYVFNRIYSESEVKILLRESGEILKGEVLIWGDGPDRELLLSPASREELEGNGVPNEKYRYIPHQEIAYIQFNEDLNKTDRDIVNREFDEEPDHPNPDADVGIADALIKSELESRGLSNEGELFDQLNVRDRDEFRDKLLTDDEFGEELQSDLNQFSEL